MDADADTGVVLAGCVGYEGELRLAVVASGLCAAEVGVGVDAALEIGFVGDIDGPPATELERAAADADAPAAGAGPIFRGARPTGGALVDMTAAILLCCYFPPFFNLRSFWPRLLFCSCLALLGFFFLLGMLLAYLIDRSSDGEWKCSCNGRPCLLVQRSQSGGLPFHWTVVVVPEQTAAAESAGGQR